MTTALQHINDLLDTGDLDSLIDARLFGNAPWCVGVADFLYRVSGPSSWRCRLCGAVELHPAQEVIGPHPRAIPRYSGDMGVAWTISDRMALYDVSTRVRFELRLNALCSSRIMLLKPHHFVVAALQTLGLVDSDGYFIEEPGE